MRAVLAFLVPAALILGGCGSSANSGAAPTPTTPASGSQASVSPGGTNHVHSILVSPANPNVVYLGTHYHLYRSNNGGHSWHPLLKQMVLSMAADRTHPGTMYGVSLQNGLIKSTDAGVTWKVISSAPRKGGVTGVAVTPTGTVLAYGLGVYRSTDGGLHWTHSLAAQSVANVAVGSNGSVYAATGNGLYVSHDSGTHWSIVGSVGNQPVVQVVASGRIAYADAVIQLLKSADGGKSWQPVPAAPPNIEFMAMSPSNPNEVIGKVAQKGFYQSHNGGATWSAANTGIHDTNFSASTIQVAPSAPNVVYTGSWGVHFYASRDAGRRWVRTSVLAA